jgi:hypothetical protein
MLETIEIEIDPNGYIRPIEPTVRLSAGRALLTLLKENQITSKPLTQNVFEDLFGILTAPQGATLEDMESAILQIGVERE